MATAFSWKSPLLPQLIGHLPFFAARAVCIPPNFDWRIGKDRTSAICGFIVHSKTSWSEQTTRGRGAAVSNRGITVVARLENIFGRPRPARTARTTAVIRNGETVKQVR